MGMQHTHSRRYERYMKGLLKSPSLNLGSNVFKIGDVNADIDKRTEPDVVFDMETDNFPMKDGSFDSILMHHSLEHLKSPEKTLRECRRLLRNNGRIVVVVPSPENKNYRMRDHKSFFTKKSLKELMGNLFSNVRVSGYRGDTREYRPFIGKVVGIFLPNQYVCIGEKK